jgi:hypothetical protein
MFDFTRVSLLMRRYPGSSTLPATASQMAGASTPAVRLPLPPTPQPARTQPPTTRREADDE